MEKLNDSELAGVSGGTSMLAFQYLVKKDDTADSIAEHFHTTAEAISRLNGIDIVNVLKPNEIILIPYIG